MNRREFLRQISVSGLGLLLAETSCEKKEESFSINKTLKMQRGTSYRIYGSSDSILYKGMNDERYFLVSVSYDAMSAELSHPPATKEFMTANHRFMVHEADPESLTLTYRGEFKE